MIYFITDPRTGIECHVEGWRNLCKMYKIMYFAIDKLEYKEYAKSLGVPIYRRTNRRRGGNFWYNVIENPALALNIDQ